MSESENGGMPYLVITPAEEPSAAIERHGGVPAAPSERGSAPDRVHKYEEEAAAGRAASGRVAIRRDPAAGSPTQGLTKGASIIM
jgi:hypothetical protein